MIKLKIKKGDNVMVISGKDRGKRGLIDKVLPKTAKVMVVGVNISKHHLKPSRKNPHGGIVDKLTPFDASNIIVICPRCGKPTKVGYKLTANSAKGGPTSGRKKMRICRKCSESIDQK